MIVGLYLCMVVIGLFCGRFRLISVSGFIIGIGVIILLLLYRLNLGGMLFMNVLVMLLVKKCVNVSDSVLVLLIFMLVFGDW